MAVITAGQTIGGWTRQTALLLPRGLSRGDGPNDFAVNRTAAAAQITPDLTGERWRLTLTGGPAPILLDRAMLAALPQHTARLPIACVEGWSTTETWTGVPLRDLARLAGVPDPSPHSYVQWNAAVRSTVPPCRPTRCHTRIRFSHFG